MEVPSGWDLNQWFLDLYATLNDAACRELDRIPSFVNVNKQDKERLREFWTHLHGSAYLEMYFSIAEGEWGKRFWEENTLSNSDKNELRILYLVRNALVHTGGDVSAVRPYKHREGNIHVSLVNEMAPFLESRVPNKGGAPPLVGMNSQRHLRCTNDKVTLTQSSFERIRYLFTNPCRLLP